MSILAEPARKSYGANGVARLLPSLGTHEDTRELIKVGEKHRCLLFHPILPVDHHIHTTRDWEKLFDPLFNDDYGHTTLGHLRDHRPKSSTSYW